MQPINYLLSGQSPFEALMGGMDGFQKYDNNKLVLEQNRIANQAAQDKADYLKQAQQEAQTLDYNDPNAIRQFIAKYESTGLTKGMTDYVANLDTNERQTMLATSSKAKALIENGDIAGAEQLARSLAQSYTNAKNLTRADEANQIANIIKTNPNAALQYLQWNMALLAPKDAAGNYKDMLGAATPTVKEFNSGGATNAYIIDPITKKITVQKLADNTVDPTKEAEFANRKEIQILDNDGKMKVARINAAGQLEVANANGTWSVRRENVSQTGQNYRQAKTMQQEDNQVEIREVGGYMLRLYGKNGSRGVDVIGKAQPKQNASTVGKVAEIQGNNDNLNQTISSLQKALQLSNQGIYDGYGANQRADFVGNFGGTEESKRTQQYTNIVQGSALQQLKAIFGGMPTEGERAVLMKLQASASYPADVREAILQEAIAAAQARIASNNRQIGTLTGQQPSYPQASAPPSSIAKPQQQGGYISGKYK